MGTPHSHVLIVEDDIKIAAILHDYLSDSGYRTERITDGAQAVTYLRSQPVDLVILDLMLPGMDGLDVCKTVRTFSQVPIIMLTARVDEIDRLLGLDSGADDYVCKPFSPREVLARARVQLRRSQPAQTPSNHHGFTIDMQTMQIHFAGTALQLTPGEFRMLAELIKHPGRVYSRQQLLNFLHEDQRDSSDRTVDSHIKNIRRKLNETIPDLDCLQSVYGAGYRFELSMNDLR